MATFAENWLESAGEVLTGSDYFVFDQPPPGQSRALVVGSSPTTGRSTSARVLFQVLLASARKSIYITTPYFLPDASIRDEISRAIRQRGVEVKILTPGPGTDHMLTRRSSRRLFGQLLEAGAKIYEYQPAMIHAKVMVIDGLWSVVGSTNMDPRSFSLNDEVNVATPDTQIAQRLQQDFFEDLRQSSEVHLEEWRNRGIAERVHEVFGGLLEKQQ
jgi:cardiolipin synthase